MRYRLRQYPPATWLMVLFISIVCAALTGPLMEHSQAQTTPRRVALLSAVTTGTSASVDASSCSSLALYASGTGTLSTGVITLEEADWDPVTATTYAGTWASLGTVTPVSGAQLVLRPSNALGSAFRYVRARISTGVTGGGTVSAVLACR